MEYKELVYGRRSIRKYKQEPVSREDILDIISTAIQAPSAGNEQMWHFMIVTNEEKKLQMADIVRNKLEQLAHQTNMSMEQLEPVVKVSTFFVNAPAVIVILTRPYSSKSYLLLKNSGGFTDKDIDNLLVRPDLQSIGAVIQNLLLAAWERGYGTCWMTGPCVARPELEAFLGVTSPHTLAALIPIGKPQTIPASRGRKDVSEVTTFID